MAVLGRIVFLSLFLIMPLWAELIIEEVLDETDSSTEKSVTLISQVGADKSKGEWRAAFMNLALPGTGHYYLGEKKKGALYLSLDIAVFAGLLFSEKSSRQHYTDSRAYARSYASVTTSRDKDDDYWRVIGLAGVASQGEYNRAMETNRTADRKYLSADDYWHWKDGVDGGSDYQEEYTDLRDKGGQWKSAANIFLGAMVLNRVVSFIDGRITAGNRANRASVLSGVQIYPHYSHYSQESGATLLVRF